MVAAAAAAGGEWGELGILVFFFFEKPGGIDLLI